MQLLDGKQTASHLKEQIKKEVESRLEEGKKRPHLAAVLVGEDPASHTYVNAKVKDCEHVGYESTLVRFDANVSEDELLQKIDQLNQDDSIDGFIVQLPLPAHINKNKVIMAIDPKKDVDGFHPENVGRMTLGLDTFIPATPNGIMEMLKHYNVPTAGKHAVVLGRSNIVGTPMSVLLSRSNEVGNCTVTITHSRTENIEEITRQADIVVAALGKPNFLKAGMVKEGVVVIDVGITRVPDDSRKRGYRLVGDADFKAIKDKCSYITPVPGGVGPMTRVSLLLNTLKAVKN